MTETAPELSLPSIADILRYVRAYAPVVYRFALYGAAAIKQLPFLGTLLSLLAGYLIILFVWNAITSTIRTAFKLAKWAALVAIAWSAYDALSGQDLASLSSSSSRDSTAAGQRSDWWSNRSRSSRRNPSERTSSSSHRHQTQDSLTMPDSLADAYKQISVAALWLSGNGKGWIWQQWQALQDEADHIDQSAQQHEKRSSWL